MAKINYYSTPKRIEKLGRDDQLALIFDLINAFSLVRTPAETALLMKDLLTSKEVKNLSKRLRIARLILAGETEREISSNLHSSFATVAKVRVWLEEGGEGLKNVISRLPAKYDFPKDLPPIPIEFQLPRVIFALIQYQKAKGQNLLLNQFAQGMDSKRILDKKLHEEASEFYKNRKKKSA